MKIIINMLSKKRTGKFKNEIQQMLNNFIIFQSINSFFLIETVHLNIVHRISVFRTSAVSLICATIYIFFYQVYLLDKIKISIAQHVRVCVLFSFSGTFLFIQNLRTFSQFQDLFVNIFIFLSLCFSPQVLAKEQQRKILYLSSWHFKRSLFFSLFFFFVYEKTKAMSFLVHILEQ